MAAVTLAPGIDDSATTYGWLLVPAVVALAVAGLLAQQRPWATALTWVLVVLLGFVNVLALLTVGIFFAPGTLTLVIACALPGRRRESRVAQYQP